MTRSPYEPSYITIAEHLRAQILSGAIAEDAKMPSLKEIGERYEVSAITARTAMDVLRHEGLVETRRGRGHFVRRRHARLVRMAPQRYYRPHKRPTWTQEADRAGATATYEHETIQTVAPADVAERLDVEPGAPVSRTAYRHEVDAMPTATSTAWEPLAITGGTEIELPHAGPHAGRGIVPRFDAIGVHVTEVEERLHFRPATPAEAQALAVAPGTGVVEIAQTFRAGDTPVEVADIVFAADRYELRYLMPIPVDDGIVHPPTTGAEGEVDFTSGLPI